MEGRVRGHGSVATETLGGVDGGSVGVCQLSVVSTFLCSPGRRGIAAYD